MATLKTVVVFDLDDTLCSELEYLQSAFKEIANNVNSEEPDLYQQMMNWYNSKEDVFSNLCNQYVRLSKDQLITYYRNHKPKFTSPSPKQFLKKLKSKGYILGLITDGRSITQRNKLISLEIEHLFDKIVISDEFGSNKTNERNYTTFHEFNADRYFYIGDNPTKDFYHPNRLGWTTICLTANEKNIYRQDIKIEKDYLPRYYILELKELTSHI